MVDAPKAQTSVEHRRKHARICIDFVEAEQVIEPIDGMLGRFGDAIDQVGDFARPDPPIEAKDLQNKCSQHRQKVNQKLDRRDGGNRRKYDDGASDDAAGQKGEGNRQTAIVAAITRNAFDGQYEVLKREHRRQRRLKRNVRCQRRLRAEMFERRIAKQHARNNHCRFADYRRERYPFVARKFVSRHRRFC